MKISEMPNQAVYRTAAPRFSFGGAGEFGRWIRRPRPLPAAASRRSRWAFGERTDAMKKLAIVALFLFEMGIAAERPDFRELPDSPAKLIEALKTEDKSYTIRVHRLDYVKESDIPELITLLDSKEPCAHVVLSISSILPADRSTVGHEAAYLIEGFWKRYYPTDLVSSRYAPDIEGMKLWYGTWSNMKRIAESGRRGVSTPAPHTTGHAGPRPAVPDSPEG